MELFFQSIFRATKISSPKKTDLLWRIHPNSSFTAIPGKILMRSFNLISFLVWTLLAFYNKDIVGSFAKKNVWLPRKHFLKSGFLSYKHFFKIIKHSSKMNTSEINKLDFKGHLQRIPKAIKNQNLSNRCLSWCWTVLQKMKPKDRTILKIFYVNQAVWLPDRILRSKLKSQTVNLPLWMFNHIQKFDFITHLVSEML